MDHLHDGIVVSVGGKLYIIDTGQVLVPQCGQDTGIAFFVHLAVAYLAHTLDNHIGIQSHLVAGIQIADTALMPQRLYIDNIITQYFRWNPGQGFCSCILLLHSLFLHASTVAVNPHRARLYSFRVKLYPIG